MIRFLIISLLITQFSILGTYSQTNTYRVFFKDKGPWEFTSNDTLYRETLSIHTEKSLERRLRTWENFEAVTLEDSPVYRPYIDSLVLLGSELKATLRWNNYVVIELDTSLVSDLEEFEFVDRVIPTRSKMLVQENEEQFDYLESYVFQPYFYGNSRGQLVRLGADSLHAMGFNGDGVIIGIGDTGYRWRDLPVFDELDIIDEYDFIFKDSITYNQDGDHKNQMNHGTGVLSVIASYYQDTLIGISNRSSFLLAKTEDLRSETHIEEDYFAEAVEWMEASGADVINTSLGYREFNETDSNYVYADLTGRSTIVADIVNKAVHRGVAFFTSAGNSGASGSYTIISPADADSVFSVAAVRVDTNALANFSSKGPRIDGAIYPNITAPGHRIWQARASGTLTVGASNGTSFASPLAAGGAALLLSAFPELRPWELRDILFRSSDHYENPDSAWGYGVPNLPNAFRLAGVAIAPPNQWTAAGKKRRVLTYILSDGQHEAQSIFVEIHGTNSNQRFSLEYGTQANQFYADIPFEFVENGPVKAYFMASAGGKSSRYPSDEDEFFLIYPDSTIVQRGVDETQLPLTVEEIDNLIAYSNYSEGLLSIGLKESGPFNIEVYNLNGNLILQEIINSNKIEIPFRSSNGVYFVRIFNENQSDIIKFICVE